MSKQFRPWKIDETQLLPPSVQDYVGPDHLSRLVVALVCESLDLSRISGSYKGGVGQPPFDPRMMTALLLHSYASGLYSSRRIARAAVERTDFMMIVRAIRRTSARSRSSADGICRRWRDCSYRC
jgi:transposase